MMHRCFNAIVFANRHFSSASSRFQVFFAVRVQNCIFADEYLPNVEFSSSFRHRGVQGWEGGGVRRRGRVGARGLLFLFFRAEFIEIYEN